MKIATAVILYHPCDDVILNITTYYNYVDKIFVFDNTETESGIKEKLSKFSKINFYHDYHNEGIAKRLNTASNIAMHEQFDWLLTMDQDSSFTKDDISNYLDCFYKYETKEKVAIFGTKYSERTNLSSNRCESNGVKELITAGMLINLSLFKKIGGFDEALFIDSVDFDYCIRARLAGYFIIEFGNIYIIHTIGKLVYKSSFKSLFLIRKKKIIHSPLRCYYIYRNMLYLEIKYKNSDKSSAKNIRKIVTTHLKECLLYGRNTWKLIKYLMAARKDFKNMKMGRIEREL
jgi:rhamnosyltransferase